MSPWLTIPLPGHHLAIHGDQNSPPSSHRRKDRLSFDPVTLTILLTCGASSVTHSLASRLHNIFISPTQSVHLHHGNLGIDWPRTIATVDLRHPNVPLHNPAELGRLEAPTLLPTNRYDDRFGRVLDFVNKFR